MIRHKSRIAMTTPVIPLRHNAFEEIRSDWLRLQVVISTLATGCPAGMPVADRQRFVALGGSIVMQ